MVTWQVTWPGGKERGINSNTPPQVLLSFLGAGFVIKEFNSKMLPEVEKVNSAKVLCEHVSWVLIVRDEVDRYFVIFNALAYVMILNVNVFHPLFLDWIWFNKDWTLIVTTNRCRCQIVAKLLEQGLNPCNLLTSIWQSHVFSFGGGECNCLLQAWLPADYAACWAHEEPSVRATLSNIPKWASCRLYKNSGLSEMRLMGWSWLDIIRNGKGAVGWDRCVSPNMVEYPKRTQLGCPLSSY